MTGLRRQLSIGDAVAVGLGSMIGAGVFVVWAPAARLAGDWLLLGLLLAAVVAVCNAWSSAALAVRYPTAGGAYVYGRERLGPWAGHLAGWSFVVGKLASCAAMALTVGAYAAPGREHLAAVVAVLLVTVLNVAGVQRSATVSRVIVTLVLAVLAGVLVAVAVTLASGDASPAGPVGASVPFSAYGVLQAAGLIFFAFAGYARIATLAEEVRDPGRTIPRAVIVTVTTVLVVYALVALLSLGALGADRLAESSAPVAAATAVLLGEPWAGAVRLAAVAAALGALLNLVLAVSRTSLAMARDGHLPRALTSISPGGVPRAAEVVVGILVLALVVTVDLREVIGFSSFGVLTYYAVAHASARTLPEWRWSRTVPLVGLVGCLVLAMALPWRSVLAGVVVLTAGLCAFAITARTPQGRRHAASAGDHPPSGTGPR